MTPKRLEDDALFRSPRKNAPVISCPGRPDDAARYVGQRLSDVETATFEEHLVGCRACQADVKLATALAHQLVGHNVKRAPRVGGTVQRRAIIGTLALAAGLLLVVTRPDPGVNPYEELGDVSSPPPYGGVGVRSTVNVGDSLFARAMAAYGNANYLVAADGLRAARNAGVDSAVTTFFIGVSMLLAGDPRTAEAELSAASAMSSGLYTGEAHYYLAKSFLRSGKPEDALRHLEMASQSASLTSSAARALADSVREIRGR